MLAKPSSSSTAELSIDRIGILAGGGRLPLTIAECVVARGGAVHIVGIQGEADADIARFPHTWVNWGQIGRMVATLRREGGGAMVIVGTVRRPDLWKLRPDWGLFVSLPQILEMMAGGDDSVLSRVVKFFETKGIAVRGAHEVAPDLLALGGPAGAASLDRQNRADAELGFAVRAALGPLDAGQAVAVAEGRVLAIEGAEGTDAMLRRVAGLRDRREGETLSGVLAKGPKPGQELRVDMPTIGPRTVELAAAAGLAGLAVEADAVLLLDRGEAVAAADARGIAIEGLPRTAVASAGNRPPASAPTKEPHLEVEQGVSRSVPSPLVGEGQGGGESQTSDGGSPPTPNPSPSCRRHASGMGGGESGRGCRKQSVLPPRIGGSESPALRAAGRLQPDARAATDIEKGLAAVARLAPFEAGKSVVVSRAYILAIAAAESTLAMLERTRALRQWGIGAKRRIGVLVCRVGTGEGEEAAPAALLDRAAAQGLAGVAVTGPPAALARFADAAALADRLGLFLTTCGERP